MMEMEGEGESCLVAAHKLKKKKKNRTPVQSKVQSSKFVV